MCGLAHGVHTRRIMMRYPFQTWAVVVMVLGPVQVATAQTTLTVPDVVTPGSSIAAIVAGPPGHHYAVIGSAVGSGVSFGGIPLSVGTDVIVLAQGVLDATGQAAPVITPPFQGTVLDRYYLQAATSPSPTFLPL